MHHIEIMQNVQCYVSIVCKNLNIVFEGKLLIFYMFLIEDYTTLLITYVVQDYQIFDEVHCLSCVFVADREVLPNYMLLELAHHRKGTVL